MSEIHLKKWNWQQPDWPHFQYNSSLLTTLEQQFCYAAGVLVGTYEHIDQEDKDVLLIELMSNEALKTSEIEGEFLNRDSIQSSIRRHLGLTTDGNAIPPAEEGIAELMVDLYHTYQEPLTHSSLFKWHRLLTKDRKDLEAIGRYRTHTEPMQIVSNALHNPTVHFEAPPSGQVPDEMETFITWFNDTAPEGKTPLPALTRASIAHLYFVSIHPFEDGNGRIGRAISEKALAQCLQTPSLVALSLTIQSNKAAYYDNLEKANKDNEVSGWLLYFANTICQAQAYAQSWVTFLIKKAKLYDAFQDQLNERQSKAIARILAAGPEGFEGGLSSKNYCTITKTSHATATRDLQDLVSKGLLKQTGALKSTRYFINFPMQDRV